MCPPDSFLSESLQIGDKFPVGNAALHPDWPEGRFNVGAMFVFEGVVLLFVDVVQKWFGCRVAVENIHGAPTVLWNGGRFTPLRYDRARFSANLENLYNRGIGCFLTFTNQLLEAGDLNDADSNCLLDIVAQRPDLNGVIVNSDLLSNYIAGRYPSLRQVASVTKVVAEGGRGKVSYYNDLGKRFYRYVLHWDDCRDVRLLDQLDRTKAEIIVNERCVRGCTLRARHYEVIAQMHRHSGSRHVAVTTGHDDALVKRRAAEQELAEFLALCPAEPMSRQIGKQQRNCTLTRNELKSLYGLGFRHFKIQGRSDNSLSFLYDLAHFTLEPACAAQLVYKAILPIVMQSFAMTQAGLRPAAPGVLDMVAATNR